MREQKFTLHHYLWENNGYEPKVEYTLSKVENGFRMHIVAQESDPRRVETRHQHYVHTDSCVEWFVIFDPELTNKYFNFEINANGAMYVNFKSDADGDSILLDVADVEALNIQAQVNENTWEITYTVPFDWIKKFIPGYEFKEGMKIRANFYKCGDATAYPHFGMWNKVESEIPCFHKSEYFREIVLD